MALRIGTQDRQCIKAFIAGNACEGHKLTTDGHRLDGHWLGGGKLATRTDNKIIMHDVGSQAAQTVQRAILREMKPRRRR